MIVDDLQVGMVSDRGMRVLEILRPEGWVLVRFSSDTTNEEWWGSWRAGATMQTSQKWEPPKPPRKLGLMFDNIPVLAGPFTTIEEATTWAKTYAAGHSPTVVELVPRSEKGGA